MSTVANDAAAERTAAQAASSATDDASAATGAIQKVNGRIPINSQYANGKYPLEKLPQDLQAKYPDSVDFKSNGHPDFGPFAKVETKVEGLTGNYPTDTKLANARVGLDKTPDGYTWHHVEDGETMQLVPSDIHRAVNHTGGASIIKGGN